MNLKDFRAKVTMKRFPGRGRETPVGDVYAIVELIMVLPRAAAGEKVHTHREGVCVGDANAATTRALHGGPAVGATVKGAPLEGDASRGRALPPGLWVSGERGRHSALFLPGQVQWQSHRPRKDTEDAIRAQSAVHGRTWGTRYIEAFMRSSCARTWCSAQICDQQFPPFGKNTQIQA